MTLENIFQNSKSSHVLVPWLVPSLFCTYLLCGMQRPFYWSFCWLCAFCILHTVYLMESLLWPALPSCNIHSLCFSRGVNARNGGGGGANGMAVVICVSVETIYLMVWALELAVAMLSKISMSSSLNPVFVAREFLGISKLVIATRLPNFFVLIHLQILWLNMGLFLLMFYLLFVRINQKPSSNFQGS